VTFDSFNFFFFFIGVYIVYLFTKNNSWKKVILIVSSYIFYASWNYFYTILLFLTTIFTYYFGKKILEEKKNKKQFLYIGVLLLILLLSVFKYWNFLAVNIDSIGFKMPLLKILLPVGISFYTFQTIGYLADCYFSKIKKTPSFLDYTLYVSFFPKLISGPIIKSYEFLSQTTKTVVINKSFIWKAIILIFFGLFKKIVFANNLAPFVDNIFTNYSIQNGMTLIVGAYAYAIQIYCDFSGYTDIAIGIAMLFGYLLPNNFNYPYLADSPSDFWKRWHITLSAWFKEYVYIPLGGSRRGELITYRNIFLVMLLTGIWHGASWNFILWGMYLALLSVGYKYFNFIGKYFEKVPIFVKKLVSVLVMLQFTVIGWIIFRSANLQTIKAIFTNILLNTKLTDFGLLNQSNQFIIILMLIFIFYNIIRQRFDFKNKMILKEFDPLIMTLILIGFFIMMVANPGKSAQFIYFKF
jgi:D-alanyl-lipoteichoic acid acyltransferase DltB (MBOAT superfamily)